MQRKNRPLLVLYLMKTIPLLPSGRDGHRELTLLCILSTVPALGT